MTLAAPSNFPNTRFQVIRDDEWQKFKHKLQLHLTKEQNPSLFAQLENLELQFQAEPVVDPKDADNVKIELKFVGGGRGTASPLQGADEVLCSTVTPAVNCAEPGVAPRCRPIRIWGAPAEIVTRRRSDYTVEDAGPPAFTRYGEDEEGCSYCAEFDEQQKQNNGREDYNSPSLVFSSDYVDQRCSGMSSDVDMDGTSRIFDEYNNSSTFDGLAAQLDPDETFADDVPAFCARCGSAFFIDRLSCMCYGWATKIENHDTGGPVGVAGHAGIANKRPPPAQGRRDLRCGLTTTGDLDGSTEAGDNDSYKDDALEPTFGRTEISFQRQRRRDYDRCITITSE
ncbi:unnamed protein product [Amoebophrya sp. A120]|nr:unnamed protein product [Amoebophrya sp. A120]|eukprot:GSA120T00010293001.1